MPRRFWICFLILNALCGARSATTGVKTRRVIQMFGIEVIIVRARLCGNARYTTKSRRVSENNARRSRT